ncbi:hypothetical protein S245_070482, partial [Arachis hypogaea]
RSEIEAIETATGPKKDCFCFIESCLNGAKGSLLLIAVLPILSKLAPFNPQLEKLVARLG